MKIKCKICNRKLKSIIPQSCKCGGYYCYIHKENILHNCTYNYLLENQEKLKRKNPKIIAEKINKLI